MEVRVLPPQLDVKRIARLARLDVREGMEEDFRAILEMISALQEVEEEVQPLYSVGREHTRLREDEEGETFGELYEMAPEREGRFVKFLSPIGRKT